MDRLLQNNNNEQSGGGGGMLQDQVGLFVFLVLSGTMVLVVGCFLAKEVYSGNGRILFVSTTAWRDRVERQRQYERDRAFAEQMQMELNDEVQAEEKARRRKERQAWYEGYLTPYTMTVTSSDLIHRHPDDADIESQSISQQQPQTHMDTTKSDDIAADDDDVDDTEHNLELILPGPRKVDGHCTICLEEYQISTQVCWSDLQCQHAFHKECILPWLAKGKKRCPICRHWFVPGARIEDQKKALMLNGTERSMTFDSAEDDEEEEQQDPQETTTTTQESGDDHHQHETNVPASVEDAAAQSHTADAAEATQEDDAKPTTDPPSLAADDLC